jgi:exopolyphosphatase/guanosine-5'-triphosphate,3'-diphosphate pyrophosphatase
VVNAQSDGPRPRAGQRAGRRSGRRGGRTHGRWGHIYAALDLGTNNCRLLVARPTKGGFRVIDAFSRIVRLGEGLGATGLISDAAMARTIEALGVCAAKMRRRGVTRARNVATETCRKARNCELFLDRVRAETGLELEIISAGEEARLAVSGCMPLIVEEARHALVFDIGGGSTELVWLRRSRDMGRIDTVSLPIGVVTLAERYGGNSVSRPVYADMVAEVAAGLEPFDRRHGIGERVAGGRVQMLGTSGTVTTLAGVQMELPRYDRSRVDGSWLSFDDALAISDRLRSMSCDDRAAHPCIGNERADLVVAGCAILEAICRTWPVGRLRVADRGIREGLLQGLVRAADREAWAGHRSR